MAANERKKRPGVKKLSYPQLLQCSVLHPFEYAQTVSQYYQAREALFFFVSNFCLGFLIRILTNVLVNKNPSFFFLGVDSLLFAIPFIVGFLLLLTLTFFIISKLLRGSASLSQTLTISCYCSTPLMLFAWVPFLSPLALLISIVLLIFSFKIINNYDLTRAGVTIIIPFMALLIWLILLGLIPPLIQLITVFPRP